jgi:hypothetical protein
VLSSLSAQLIEMVNSPIKVENFKEQYTLKFEDFMQQSILKLQERIVQDFQNALSSDASVSGPKKVDEMLCGVLQAEKQGVKFCNGASVVQFYEIKDELLTSVITACYDRLEKAATCTSQSIFDQAHFHLSCVTQYLATIKHDIRKNDIEESLVDQKASLLSARESQLHKIFQFTTREVPECKRLLEMQRQVKHMDLAKSWVKLDSALNSKLQEINDLTSTVMENLEMGKIKEIRFRQVFEKSSGIIQFGSDCKELLQNHCTHADFRRKVFSAAENLSLFAKKLLDGFDKQLRLFNQLADLGNTAHKLIEIWNCEDLCCWRDAESETFPKLLQRCSDIEKNSKEADERICKFCVTDAKEFDMKKHDQAETKKFIETLSHVRRQKKGGGEFEDVCALLRTQIDATGSLQVKIQVDYKIDVVSFEQFFAAMKNCQEFESVDELRTNAMKQRTEAEDRLRLVTKKEVLGSFLELVKVAKFDSNHVDALASTGNSIDNIFYDSFKNCFPDDTALMQHFKQELLSRLQEKKEKILSQTVVKEIAQGMIAISNISTAVSSHLLPEVRSEGEKILKHTINNLPQGVGIYALVCDPFISA